MITIKEFCSLPYSNGVAYVLGLIYPLFKIKDLTVGTRRQSYLIGSVNHNPGRISLEDLKIHYLSVSTLLRSIDDGLIYDNSVYQITNKHGFSVIIALDDASISATTILIDKKVKELKYQDTEIKKYFIRGCFDGRSSYDRTTGMLAVDVDRDYSKQEFICDIAASFDIRLNRNTRDINHPKNDQIRVLSSDLSKFCSKIGFYSVHRKKQCI